MQKMIDSLAVYWDRRMARIMLLGIISGFPGCSSAAASPCGSRRTA